MKQGRLFLGTSGWMYKDWGKRFYPEGMKKGHLSFLAQELNTVEINSSFYHLPRKTTFEKWTDETPEYFTFSVKLSQYITHKKLLKGVRGSLERFIKHAEPMREKLGVILVQLPPWLKFSTPLITRFLKDIDVVRSRNYPVRFALEPRHKSWVVPEKETGVRMLLRNAGVAIVFPHSSTIPSFPPIEENITADFLYIRFHGPGEFASSLYGPNRLRPWAERIQEWVEEGRDVFVYFNNDVHGHAIDDVRTLSRLLEKRLGK